MRAIQSVVVVAVLVAAAGSGPAAAQGVTVLVGGGAAVPVGYLNSSTNTGFHGMAAVSVAPATVPVRIRIEGMYSSLGFIRGVDGHFRVLQGSANAVYGLPAAAGATIRPYLIGGLGVYNYKSITDISFIPDEAHTDLGINGGAGVDVLVGALGVFAEVRYHNVFLPGKNLKLLPITVGVQFGGR
jgi:hypothetical protein